MPVALAGIRDSRQLPQISTAVIVRSAFIMFLARLGSLNALEQLGDSSALRDFIGARLPSADTVGRVVSLMDPNTIRKANRDIYSQLKRNKSLELLEHGLVPLTIDGHESHATYLRHCEGCLERRLNKDTDSEKVQYYHRHVTAQLVFRNFSILLDLEPQMLGEGERAAAQRLLERVLRDYPRAFDVVVADALYCCAPFINFVIDCGKDVVVVAKDDRYEIVKDAESFLQNKSPSIVIEKKNLLRKCWDESGFECWAEVKVPLRVTKTEETKRACRQLDGVFVEETSSWMWVTTLSNVRASAATVAEIGHLRWNIENQGFNEMVNHWGSDHIYKHHPIAILNFWLLCMTAYNIFRCFYIRNLKPALRASFTMLHVSRQVQAALYMKLHPAAHPT